MNVAIVGAGKLGYKIAESLVDGDYAITIIDTKQDLLDKISQKLDVMTINEDARSISVLNQIRIDRFDYLLSATNSDEANIVIASFAKKLGCKHVIARVRDPEHMNQFDFIQETMGIDFIVNPDMAITSEIYKYLAEKYTLSTGVFSTGKVSILEVPAARISKLIGKSIPEIREIFPDFLILSISRKGKVIIPHGKHTVTEGDIIYMMGETKEINELNRKVRVRTQASRLNKVMIIGGGKTGYYLAKKLANFGTAVKLVESNLNRCHYLSSHLSNVMVLHANGTDLSVLEEENLDEMDAFITATGYDEENLLLALTAKHRGITDVISKVSHENYKELIEEMGVDVVLNPLDISASNILRYIQGSKRIISSVLIQGQAEIMEIIASNKMRMINVPISQLKLPDSILIGSITRGNELIIPTGDTKILPGDHVIMLCLLTSIGDLEKLMKPKRL